MHVAVIINPVSGLRRRAEPARHRVELAARLLEAARLPGDVLVTERPAHASALAREAVVRGAALVIAWGGDGTVNEVGAALAFGEVPLGIVPAGSGNGLARELGLPRRPAGAFRAALRGHDRTIDAGELGGRLFFNVAGIGFDAHVAARFNALAQGRRGALRYLAIALRELVAYRAPEYAIRVDGETLRVRALLVACANSRQYGGHARIAPLAQLDDGALDLVLVEARSPLAVLWQARRLFAGTLAGAPRVRMRTFRQLEVTADEPLFAHVDGESVTGSRTLTVRVRPGALRVRVAALSPPLTPPGRRSNVAPQR